MSVVCVLRAGPKHVQRAPLQAPPSAMEIKMQTHTQSNIFVCLCVLAPSRISFARERDEAEKIKRIKYKNGNNNNNSNNKAETETEAGRAKHNGAPACPLAEADRQRDIRTDGQTYLRSNVNPFAATLPSPPSPTPAGTHPLLYGRCTHAHVR